MIQLRPFNLDEFSTACQIKKIENDTDREKYRARFANSGQWDGHYLNCAIDFEGVAVGELQVRHCDQSMPPGTAEVGIELLPAFQGKGIGTQTMRATAKRLFAEGFHRLSGSTDVSNIAMQHVFEKAGWQFEGVHRNFMPQPGEQPHDYRVYAITLWDSTLGGQGLSSLPK
jgi:RimJ/RimL family protein N-acetyltransferase